MSPTSIPPSNTLRSRSRSTPSLSRRLPPMSWHTSRRELPATFLTTLYLATTAPVVVAPAMNVNMWNHPATQANLQILRQRGVKIVEPGAGYLACGMTGPGRLAENESIVAAVLRSSWCVAGPDRRDCPDHRRSDARKNRSRALPDQPLQRAHGLRSGGSCRAKRARAFFWSAVQLRSRRPVPLK